MTQARRSGPRPGGPHPHQRPGSGGGPAAAPAGAPATPRAARGGWSSAAAEQTGAAPPAAHGTPCRPARRCSAAGRACRGRSLGVPGRPAARGVGRRRRPQPQAAAAGLRRRGAGGAHPLASASSACSSRSSSASARTAATSSSWASAGCAPPGRPAWTTVPAIVRDTTDDALLRDALLENIHRVQLNPLEEAAAYQQLLEEFGATHEELASKIGRSRSQVTNTIRLMKLPVKVQTRVAAGVISAGHARALLGLPDAEAQDALATRIVAEGMSVRATEEAVAMAAAEQPTAKRRARKITAPGVEDLGSAGSPTCSRPRSRSRSAGRRADRRRVRIGRRPAADHRRHGAGDHRTPPGGLIARDRGQAPVHVTDGTAPGPRSRRSAATDVAAAPGEQPGEHLAELVAGGLDRHREHRGLGEPRGDVHLEEVHLAVRASRSRRCGTGRPARAPRCTCTASAAARAATSSETPRRGVVLGQARACSGRCSRRRRTPARSRPPAAPPGPSPRSMTDSASSTPSTKRSTMHRVAVGEAADHGGRQVLDAG